MKNKALKIKVFSSFLLVVALFAGSGTGEAKALAVANCSFYRDLTVGTRGEDVRCLQQYLQNSGYGSTFSSYGTPDGVFGPLTQQAVIQWQTSSGLPVYGYFDSASRTKYISKFGGTVNSGTYSHTTYGTSVEVRAMNQIREALIMIEDAQDEIDDSNGNTTSAENSLDDAQEDMVNAVHAYFVDKDFNEAYDLALDALDNAEDAYDDAGGNRNNSSNNGTRSSAEDAIEDASDAIDDAQDEINRARNRGRNVNNAQNLINKANDKLDDAEEEFDDKNYDDVEDFANDAEDFANDAVDAIN